MTCVYPIWVFLTFRVSCSCARHEDVEKCRFTAPLIPNPGIKRVWVVIYYVTAWLPWKASHFSLNGTLVVLHWSIWSFEESTSNSCQESKGVSSVIHFVDYSLCRIAFPSHWMLNLNIFFSRTIFRGIKTEWRHFTILSVCMTPTHSWNLYPVMSTPIIFIFLSVYLCVLYLRVYWSLDDGTFANIISVHSGPNFCQPLSKIYIK